MIRSNDFFVEVNLPKAPEGEGLHQLPPYDRKHLFLVDDYPDCPKAWPRSSGKVSSYFLPVEAGKHLWLDFNANYSNNHNVAILLSVQGINPITGQKPSQKLEQYRENCPIHGTPFGHDLLCTECGYKWPAQNYITTASTPHGLLWIDGWKTGENEIRGFLFTSETMRGVAAQLIGDDRAFAIGISFFPSKAPKPQQIRRDVLRAMSFNQESPYVSYNAAPVMRSARSMTRSMTSLEVERQDAQIEQLEIGAGAKIAQNLSYLDNLSVSDYSDEPATTVYINYCTKEQCAEILKYKYDEPRGEGFLKNLTVGN